MSNQAKMLILTSNEDLIQQLSSNKSENTQMINLDPNDSILKDNKHFFDLNSFAQLSQLDSTNDQMYKRVLHSPQPNRSKIAKISKKNVDLLCVICEDVAIGFNYDALTCASCKAFFRRNAQYNPTKLRCLTGDKNCSVTNEIRRKCQRCRLVKCLSMGMRKDFILSEEEKQRRKERIEENRQLANTFHSSKESLEAEKNQNYFQESIHQIDRLLMETDNETLCQSNDLERTNPFPQLSLEDLSDIENIRRSYFLIYQNENQSYRTYEAADRVSALVSWSELASERSLKLINFFRQIEEFDNLNDDDRFTLIKYNLYPIYVIQRSLYYDPITKRFLNRTNVDPIKRQEFFILCYGTSGIRENFKSLINSLSIIFEQDSTLIYLFMIILLFSKGLSMNEHEPILHDQLAVNRAQCHYLRLTWNYLISKQGEMKTLKQFSQLIGQIQKIQLYTKCFREYFQCQSQSTDVLDRLAPLMQSVLNI